MMITSADMSSSRERCRSLGIPAYPVKAVAQSSLYQEIRKALAATADSKSPVKQPPAKAKADKTGLQRRPTFLLVEDHEINRKLVIALLQQRGWQVDWVDNGARALDEVARGSYDLVLMDVQMPVMDGLEATRRIRQLPGSAGSIPVIGLTDHALPDDRERCLACGMNRYLSKPLNPQTLFETIEELLPGVNAVESGTAGVRVNLNELFAVLNHDMDAVSEFINHFVSDWPDTRDAMRTAVQERDDAALEQLTHNFKSVAGIFGAAQTVQLTRRLEELARARTHDEAPGKLQELEQEVAQVVAILEHLAAKGCR